MNPASLTPSSLTESRITLQTYRVDPAFSAHLHHAARRDRALAIGRLVLRLMEKLVEYWRVSRRVTRPATRPMSLPFARWG